MSQDEGLGNGKKKIESLYVILRNRHIECGVIQVESGRAVWKSVSAIEIEIQSNNKILINLEDALNRSIVLISEFCGQWGEVHVLATEQWVYSISIPWSEAFFRHDTKHRYLQGHILSSGIEIMPGDVLRVDEGSVEQPCIAALYVEQLVEMFQAWSSRIGGVLASIQPYYLAGWLLSQRLRKDKPRASDKIQSKWNSLAIVDGNSVILIIAQADRSAIDTVFIGASNLQIDAAADPISNSLMGWRRFLLRNPQFEYIKDLAIFDVSNRSMELIELASGNYYEAASSKIEHADFINASRTMQAHPLANSLESKRFKSTQLVVLFTLFLTLFVLAIQIGLNASKYYKFIAMLAETQQSMSAANENKVWSKQELNRIQAINKAISDLNVPVDALLESLIPPKDIRVAILGMETGTKVGIGSSSAPSIKLQGQACSSADMAQYVAFVSDKKPFIGASLMHHEYSEKLGKCPYKFSVEAKWSE